MCCRFSRTFCAAACAARAIAESRRALRDVWRRQPHHNEQNRKLIAALQQELEEMGRVFQSISVTETAPLLADTIAQMKADGVGGLGFS